jgi:superfamily II DNA/RNA helicase
VTLNDVVVDPALPETAEVTTEEIIEQGPTFADLPLGPELQRAVATLGYTAPTPIQAEAITPLVEGRDLIGQAATGTGKTAAFALPMLERLGEQRPDRRGRTAPFGLVLAPTRELALQVSEAITSYGRGMGARVLTVYGGAPVGPQLRGLSDGVDVVVATPGRAIDLMNRGALRLDELEVVVLDEADEMLDMGFLEDIETLLSATPDTRQAMLFSATIPRRIEALARMYLREPIPFPRARRPRSARPPTWCRARTRRRHSAGSSRPSARPRRSSSAAPASTSTPSPRPSPRAACAPRPSTAGWTRSTAPASSSGCATAGPTCWSPRTSRPAAWTSSSSRTW